MSRTLPARPNLEYLKKEAKDHLDELRRSRSDAQLSDAQFALARGYGFDSWPKLKAHVEALADARPASPLAGNWLVNVEKSVRHPANLFKRGRIHIAVNGSSVDLVDEFVDETGRAIRGRNHLDVDGVARDFANGYTVSAVWIANGLQTVATKDGQVVGGATYEVSTDGRLLTITDTAGHSTIVLDRLIQ